MDEQGSLWTSADLLAWDPLLAQEEFEADRSRNAISAIGYLVFKRTVDILCVILIGVPFILVLPLLALAIRLDSPGPIFYGQMRVGRDGQHFRIYKLRTMWEDAERDGARWALACDPRVTRLGRILRKTRVDECPQLFNIIRGDMTLIGPRPERPEFTSLLRAELPRYEERLKVAPGLTGWAQVNHTYTNSVEGTRAKLALDLYYIANAGLVLDLLIIWRTFLVVLGRKGW